MNADSGASDTMVDDEGILKLQGSLRDYKKMKEPEAIVTVADEKVLATATGTVWGYTIDQARERARVRSPP